jgi:hypothetical protein
VRAGIGEWPVINEVASFFDEYAPNKGYCRV